jgi:hypothetical protein
MMDRLRIKTRLLVVFLLVGLVPLGFVTLMALNKAGQALGDETRAKFAAVQEIKKKPCRKLFQTAQKGPEDRQRRSICSKCIDGFQ